MEWSIYSCLNGIFHLIKNQVVIAGMTERLLEFYSTQQQHVNCNINHVPGGRQGGWWWIRFRMWHMDVQRQSSQMWILEEGWGIVEDKSRMPVMTNG